MTEQYLPITAEITHITKTRYLSDSGIVLYDQVENESHTIGDAIRDSYKFPATDEEVSLNRLEQEAINQRKELRRLAHAPMRIKQLGYGLTVAGIIGLNEIASSAPTGDRVTILGLFALFSTVLTEVSARNEKNENNSKIKSGKKRMGELNYHLNRLSPAMKSTESKAKETAPLPDYPSGGMFTGL